MKQIALKLATVGLIASTAALPVASFAQYRDSSSHRQHMKNQWRNIGYGSAALGVLGLLNHNSTLTAAGVLGAGYSAYRYEQDRKAQNRYRYGYNDYNRYRYNRYNGYNGYNGYRSERYGSWHHDNGRHLGWYKGHGHHRDDD